METTYRVLRIDEQLYGCEELPAGQPVLCDVTLADFAGARRTLPYPDKELIRAAVIPRSSLKHTWRHFSFPTQSTNTAIIKSFEQVWR